MGKDDKTSERFDNQHKTPPVITQSMVVPARKVSGVCNKENVKSSLLPGCHSAKHSSAENKPSDSAFSKTVVKRLIGNVGSRSSSTLSCPVNSRISLGPLVKTKTGLVPAVTHSGQNRLHTSARELGATKPVVKKFTSRDSTSLTASKSSSILTDKKMFAPDFKSSDKENKTVSSMAAAKIKVQGQNKASSNLQLDKSTRPSKSQQSNQQKSTSSLHNCTNTANNHKEKLSKCNKSTTQPTNCSKNPKPELKVGKGGQLPTVPSQTSRAAGVCRKEEEQALKNRTSTKRDGKVGWTSANVQQQRRTVAAKPARTVSLANQSISAKGKAPDTLIPQADGKRQTAAQAERM